MYSLMRAFVWLIRWRHCCGFGVQSPWAYRFVRYVVNEHYPYYSYDALESRWREASSLERKLGRLYFRLANYLQPSLAADYSQNGVMFADYVRSGCRSTELCDIPMHSTSGGIHSILSGHRPVPFLRVVTQGNYVDVFHEALAVSGQKSVFVIEGINSDKSSRAFWKHIVASELCVTTFDLYYCGIIFFDRSRYKENYIVNF